jgi:hypothetical protein
MFEHLEALVASLDSSRIGNQQGVFQFCGIHLGYFWAPRLACIYFVSHPPPHQHKCFQLNILIHLPDSFKHFMHRVTAKQFLSCTSKPQNVPAFKKGK